MKTWCLSLLLLMFFFESMSQVKLGDINSTSQNSVLELNSTSKVFLPPRLTTAQRTAIQNPVEGLLIYNVERECIEVFDGDSWDCNCKNSAPAKGNLGKSYIIPHGVSIVAFSNNNSCRNKAISAGYLSATCNATTAHSGYSDTLINGQCWLSKNSNTGPGLYIGYDTARWKNIKVEDKGFWGYYDTLTTNGSGGWSARELAADVGLLYQWSAAMNGSTHERAQGVCPSGYHIPSDCEWKFLEHGLGMSITDQNAVGFRASGNVGDSLKSTAAGGANTTGWSGLMGGGRSDFGNFVSFRSVGTWWTSTSGAQGISKIRQLYSGFSIVYREDAANSYAYSVRCIKD